MKKVTQEIKIVMKELRAKGITFEGIAKILNISSSTVQYHLSEKQKQNTLKRAKKNPKKWNGAKKYMQKYMVERYNNDDEFRERVKKHSREYWRRMHGKSNNLS